MTISRVLGVDDLKKIIDFYETLDKQELIERLTMANAKNKELEKEIDRIAEERDNILTIRGNDKK
jgi:predicted transcriptional regulator|tara:strand:+ start:525 stop:719 length:195 start_codon:yes stop_codon:yes gene_type:complete